MKITVHFSVGTTNPHDLVHRLVEKGMIVNSVSMGLGVIHGHLPERHKAKEISNMDGVEFLSYNLKEEHREHPTRTLKEAKEHVLAILLKAEAERDELLAKEIFSGEN
jgi:hypothetical protein